jgi:plastocyanin
LIFFGGILSTRILALVLVAATLSCGGYSAPTNPGDGGQMPNPPPSGTLAQVTIQDFSFDPSTLSIKAGTIVRWTNNGPSAHTAVSDAGTWGSPSLSPPVKGGGYGDGGSPGGTFDFTFTEPGTYSYHCSLHPPSSYPGFTGTITVTP